jgi:hypothetical protein
VYQVGGGRDQKAVVLMGVVFNSLSVQLNAV